MRATPDNLRRMADRSLNYKKQPDPPRGLKFDSATGILSWEPPRDATGVTHFNIYANTEKKLVRQVPGDQLQLADNLVADRVFVSSFNKFSSLESEKAFLATAIAPVSSLNTSLIISYS